MKFLVLLLLVVYIYLYKLIGKYDLFDAKYNSAPELQFFFMCNYKCLFYTEYYDAIIFVWIFMLCPCCYVTCSFDIWIKAWFYVSCIVHNSDLHSYMYFTFSPCQRCTYCPDYYLYFFTTFYVGLHMEDQSL